MTTMRMESSSASLITGWFNGQERIQLGQEFLYKYQLPAKHCWWTKDYGHARQPREDRPRQEAEMTRWWLAMIANVILRMNLKHWLHAAFPGPSKVPWQRFSQLYWYQKGCQEGFHGPNVREMAQNMITHITDRLQQLPLWGANWYPMVWNQDSHGQLLQSRNLKPHRKNVETSPVCTSVLQG